MVDALTIDGNVYLALWDGSGVAVLDYSGNLIEIIEPASSTTHKLQAGWRKALAGDNSSRRIVSRAALQCAVVWFGS